MEAIAAMEKTTSSVRKILTARVMRETFLGEKELIALEEVMKGFASSIESAKSWIGSSEGEHEIIERRKRSIEMADKALKPYDGSTKKRTNAMSLLVFDSIDDVKALTYPARNVTQNNIPIYPAIVSGKDLYVAIMAKERRAVKCLVLCGGSKWKERELLIGKREWGIRSHNDLPDCIKKIACTECYCLCVAESPAPRYGYPFANLCLPGGRANLDDKKDDEANSKEAMRSVYREIFRGLPRYARKPRVHLQKANLIVQNVRGEDVWLYHGTVKTRKRVTRYKYVKKNKV